LQAASKNDENYEVDSTFYAEFKNDLKNWLFYMRVPVIHAERFFTLTHIVLHRITQK
jgi:hypothetical protein